MRYVALWSLMIGVLQCPVPTAAQEAPVPPAVEYAYELATRRVTLHEPVIVVLTIRNQGPDGVVANFGPDSRGHFVVRVRTPGGELTPRLTPLLNSGERLGAAPDELTSTGAVLIRSGTRHEELLVLHRWVDFSEPGRYQVTITLPVPLRIVSADVDRPPAEPLRWNLPSIDMSRGATFDVDVLPRDPERLAVVCDQLVSSIEHADDPRPVHVAAWTLAGVLDPVAVPYIQRALMSRRPGMLFPDSLVDQVLIPALREIGTTDAVAVLEELTASADDIRRRRAERALAALQRRNR